MELQLLIVLNYGDTTKTKLTSLAHKCDRIRHRIVGYVIAMSFVLTSINSRALQMLGVRWHR